jgi:multidrug efflux pump subunit AcrA (membrane-fusion protein)
VRSNAVLPAIQARENEIAREAAGKRLSQAKQNLNNKNDNLAAAVKVQQANQNKAKVTAEMNRKIIENMVVKAKTAGYVNLQNNTRNQFFWYEGMTFPTIQLGDTVFAGMPIAQILDLKNWEVSAEIGELDRGHLSEGQKVSLTLVALPGQTFSGHIKMLGGTTGSAWDRHFDCRIALDQAAPEMRPGLTSNMVITTQVMDNVTWLPSQALFESAGKTFVYQRSPQGFNPRDVTMVSRSESQVVINGLKEGEVVAMSNPEQQNKPAAQASGAMKALQK